MVDPGALSPQLGDAGPSPCSFKVQGCKLAVNCAVEGLEVAGQLTWDGKQLEGYINLKEPIKCAYWVTAEPQ